TACVRLLPIQSRSQVSADSSSKVYARLRAECPAPVHDIRIPPPDLARQLPAIPSASRHYRPAALARPILAGQYSDGLQHQSNVASIASPLDLKRCIKIGQNILRSEEHTSELQSRENL